MDEKRIDIKFLENITGGFTEEAGLPTKGKNIQCPNCHSSNKESFSANALWDQKTNSVEYHCNDCDTDFVCYEGYVIVKNNWVKLCQTKNYNYPFA